MSISTLTIQPAQPAVLPPEIPKTACGQYHSERDNMLYREFVGADIKHVWGKRSLEIREVDL